ncbi:MAG TPA: DNA gyrase inhibitor YacG [Rhodocyclaceae bacterium]|nr:DNA gyrase inhibitor YacG [Rhodocyclaceae bacterium]
MPEPIIVKCPQCGKPVQWVAESAWRPFCSERCKQLDLGAWASESYRVRAGDEPAGGSEDDRPERD